MAITCINERTSETCDAGSLTTAKTLHAQGFTRIEHETRNGTRNYIYRRLANGQMTWLDEDEHDTLWTFDDGKGVLKIQDQIVPSINAAIKWANTRPNRWFEDSLPLPETLWITYDGSPEVRLRWNKRRFEYML